MHLKPQINTGKTIFWCRLHSIVLNTFPPVTFAFVVSWREAETNPQYALVNLCLATLL
ncbi:hypothetical protein QWZ13_11625 [Reinekea marina]|uniref:hypothetical protein n=1 Tax=Reinekea marina TaxID=1310421 RepID=UPI0025B4D20A|nr:hypothetical protein [Reinekea marina]MDN3649565.1 hypothetical protein [Reinekea marina]